jgi:hypothetical protein
VTTDEAHARWTAAGVPKPSIVVRSGSGIHAYWLLENDLTTPEARSRLAARAIVTDCSYRRWTT